MADEALKEDGIVKKGELGQDIYVKNIAEIKMNIGDAVLYRGMDKWHWREFYKEGKWQAQVFLHYVDKNGPHSEWKYDKRPSLGITKPPNLVYYDSYYKPNLISEGFCDRVIKEYSNPEIKKELPIVGPEGEGMINLDIRDVQRLLLPLDSGIGATLTAFGLNTNHEIWKYNITHSNQCEFLMYNVDGKYETHVDNFHQESDNSRKLTVIAFLNDDFEGGKFYIQNAGKYYPPQEKGTAVVFPSYMPHGVEPITKGVRYSVVSWMLGPYFK
jgi:PKHD-type hydroxylase